MLSTTDHDRGAAGMTYVYPVVSRRAGGVSIGVNLNPNQACNWRCLYCQVPNLTRGAGPAVDLALLRSELDTLLGAVQDGSWLEENAPEGMRRLTDVALSGDGEPTTSPDLGAALGVVGEVLAERGLALPLVLITNGSQVHKPEVQAALRHLGELGGRLWFKLDAGTEEGRARLNDARVPQERLEEGLATAASLCPVRLQVMWLALDGEAPSEAEQEAWIATVRRAQERGAELVDVLLYGLARPSLQPEAPRLTALPREELEAFAARVERELDLSVHVTP